MRHLSQPCLLSNMGILRAPECLAQIALPTLCHLLVCTLVWPWSVLSSLHQCTGDCSSRTLNDCDTCTCLRKHYLSTMPCLC
jgi:hypothetical protein